MASSAAFAGLMDYPSLELNQALYDLLLCQFHDILPGSSIQPVEEASLRCIDHGLEILSRLKTRAFFALSSGQSKGKDGEIPILIYNPHPFPVKGIFECEFQLQDQNWKEEFTLPVVYGDNQDIASQPEKEFSNVPLDWRKRVVFSSELLPSQMNRFDCKLETIPQKSKPELVPENDKLHFKTQALEVVINCKTGLLDEYKVDGIDYLRPNSFLPLIIEDNDDPWSMNTDRFPEVAGNFKLMDPAQGTKFSGVTNTVLDSVRVIEDGSVRTVVEAVFAYGDSFICQRYKLPKRGTEVEVEVRAYWQEKSKMLKLSVPTTLTDGKYLGQVAYGVEELPTDGKEVVAQKWVALSDDEQAVTLINDGIYGSDSAQGEIRLSLLRSPAYCGHPIEDRTIMPQDRFSPRIDQGERLYTFWLNAGPAQDRLEAIDREALVHNEKPFVLSFFPSGLGNEPESLVELKDSVVQVTAFKKAEQSADFIMRLYNPTNIIRKTTLRIPPLDLEEDLSLGAFELKTLKLDIRGKSIVELDLLER